MSAPPLCKVCEKAHWPRDPHSFGVDPAKPAKVAPTSPPARKVPAPIPASCTCAQLAPEVARLKAEVARLSKWMHSSRRRAKADVPT